MGCECGVGCCGVIIAMAPFDCRRRESRRHLSFCSPKLGREMGAKGEDEGKSEVVIKGSGRMPDQIKPDTHRGWIPLSFSLPSDMCAQKGSRRLQLGRFYLDKPRVCIEKNKWLKSWERFTWFEEVTHSSTVRDRLGFSLDSPQLRQ